jgi:hypothetical protein
MAMKKEGSSAAFWVIIIFLGIVIAVAAWFFLKREEKPVKANPSQTSSLRRQSPRRASSDPQLRLKPAV